MKIQRSALISVLLTRPLEKDQRENHGAQGKSLLMSGISALEVNLYGTRPGLELLGLLGLSDS
ncbi:hypothetical protein N7539_002039 [Penicillium diatomitis]|uniref:Uncharacterized protein n=1 Tax=Penicillium diatomitis TaxID=2819901 RepID=A0A9W9XHU9_9EURO|nr:uncharacterized protein N7539_002039 [Penicillium diatomitis]KAJ5493293.1 hypothetical protein N7539_002039 [Penicillium diatomitis]